MVAVGRYTLSTGESVLRGFHRVHGVLGAVATILAAGVLLRIGAFAASSGTALAALLQVPGGFAPHGRALLWSYAGVAAAGAAIVLPGATYRRIERCALAGVLITAAALLWVCVQPEVRSALPTFAVALGGPPGPSERAWDVHDSAALVAAVTLFGLGGFWIPIYSAWIRASGIGTADGERLVDDSPSSAAAWPPWRRSVGADTLSASAGNLLATLLVCLVAYAVLYPRGLVPQGDVTSVLSASYDVPWGAAARALLLVVAAAVSLGAWLAAVDGSSRMYAELIACRRSGLRSREERRGHLATVAIACAITCLALPLGGGEVLAQLATVTAFVAAVFFPPALFVLVHRRLAPALPVWARPRRREALALAASAALHALLAAAYAWASWPWW